MIGTHEAKVLESGSVMVGTVDDDGVPDASRAWGAWPLDGGRRLRVLLPVADARTLGNLRANGRLAVNAADVVTLDSVQVKARVTAIQPPTADDLELSAAYTQHLFRVINESDGTPVELLRSLLVDELVAVDAEVDAVFDQTPGPGAGRPIT